MALADDYRDITKLLRTAHEMDDLAKAFARLCLLWKRLSAQVDKMQPAGMSTAGPLAVTDLQTILTSSEMRVALRGAYRKAAPGTPASPHQIADDMASTLALLASSLAPNVPARVRRLTDTAVSVGVMQGQICTLADLLQKKSLSRRLLEPLRSTGMMGAVAGTALNVAMFTGPVDTAKHTQETVDLVKLGATELLEQARKGLEPEIEDKFRSSLNLPQIKRELNPPEHGLDPPGPTFTGPGF